LLKTGLIVIQNGLYYTLVIVLEGVYIVIARDVYAKDAQAGVHGPRHCRDRPIADLKALFVQEGEEVLGCVRPITFKRLD
jgi:hypothetical protein